MGPSVNVAETGRSDMEPKKMMPAFALVVLYAELVALYNFWNMNVPFS